METLSSLVIPAVLLFAGFLMAQNKKDGSENLFDAFLRGGKEGIRTTLSLIPTLTALVCALTMFKNSGAAELITRLASPLLCKLGIPPEVIPLAVTRPVSGSASTAAFSALLSQTGADSLASVCAAILMGSSDTLIYVMGVYFSVTHVKHTSRALTIGGVSALLCLFLSAALARLFLGRSA